MIRLQYHKILLSPTTINTKGNGEQENAAQILDITDKFEAIDIFHGMQELSFAMGISVSSP